MYRKRSLVLFAAAVVLLAGSPVARANDRPDKRSGGLGLSEHQTELDEQFARSHQTVMPGTPARPISPYGYAARHRPAAKHQDRTKR
jgi:hypothetical protein